MQKSIKTNHVLTVLTSFVIMSSTQSQDTRTLEVQGHRGARGLYPENSIAAFEHALKLGVHTLELDVVISKDHKVIISHEPFMSSDICLNSEGKTIEESEEKNYNIYKLSYEEIKSFDCGSKVNKDFPSQAKMSIYKPSLSDMVHHVEKISNTHAYNIEIKRRKSWDSIMHPDYMQFADLVISEITELGIKDRTTVQCFDVETLQYLNKQYPSIKLVYLVHENKSFKKMLDKLGFKPHVYSPYYKLVNESLVAFCKKESIRLIPWTVNEKEDMQQLINIGCDGIITDYPDSLIQLLIE